MLQFLDLWYRQPIPFVSLAALVVAALLAIWVLWDASRKAVSAAAWKILTVVGALVVLPSVVLGVVPDLLARSVNLIQPLAILGAAGLVAAIIGALGYGLVGAKAAAQQPYAAYPETQAAYPPASAAPIFTDPAPPAFSAPPAPPTQPVTTPLGSAGFDVQAGFGQPGAAPSIEGTVVLKKKPSALAWLVIRGGQRDGKDFRLGELTKVGRDATQCEVVVDDPSVSRLHASIRLSEDGQFVITDLDSANHTYVNGAEIVRTTLHNGDSIKLGETSFIFMHVEDKPKPAADPN